MKNKFAGILLFSIFSFFIYELYSIYAYLDLTSLPVLSTPFGNLMISLSPNFTGDFFYYRHYELTNISQHEFSNWWFGLSPNIAAIVFYLLSCLYILLFAKIRKLEGSFLIFAFVISLQYILFFDFIGKHQLYFYFYLTTLLSNIAFTYLFFTLLNRKLPQVFGPLSLLIIFFMAIFFFPGTSREEIQMIKILGVVHLITFIGCFILFIYDEFRQRKRYTVRSHLLRRVFVLTSLSIIFVPSVSYLWPVFNEMKVSIYNNVIFYIPALFPLIFLMLSLHNSYIFFKRPVKTWFFRLVYFIFYMFLYGIIIGFESQFIFSKSGILILYIASVFAFIFVFDLLRLLTQITVSFYLNYRKLIFEEHITDIFQYIQTPFQIEDGLNRFIKMTESGLMASKVTVLLNGDLFGDWVKEKGNIRLIKDDDPIWSYRKKRFLLRPKLLISQKDKGYPALFLKKYSGVAMIFFPSFNSGIILSEKQNQTPYISEDLKYIFDLVRHIEPVLENYKLLIDTIETKKINKQLEVVSRVQKKLMIPESDNPRVKLHYYIKPYRYVTGDYLEIFNIKPDHLIFFLGDVSGHGLSSAYFTGLVRALIDGSIQSGKSSITEIFNLINQVLCSKQSSSSFMTMSAIELEISSNRKKYSANLKYINAGQHPPFLYLMESKKLIKLSDNQRVLGVIETKYSTRSQRINENFRLILTSDGAFEIFNAKGEILGEEKFLHWIESTTNLSPEDQKTAIMTRIREYSHDPDMYDDISILITDIQLD